MNNSQLPAAPLHNDELVRAFMDVEKVAPNGLTKREHFAGLAMQGILAHSFGRGDADELAIQSIKCADALLKELAK